MKSAIVAKGNASAVNTRMTICLRKDVAERVKKAAASQRRSTSAQAVVLIESALKKSRH